jgi:hypothetical protein
VLGVCDRNMKFVYVLAGWEGSASDGRVLRDAMDRDDSFKVPNGNSYLSTIQLLTRYLHLSTKI